MSSHLLFKYEKLEGYEFDELPKGCMAGLVMNPYNGNVFLDLEKHKASSKIALDIMREVVTACGVLERKGSIDPLRDLLSMCAAGDWKPAFKASAEMLAFKGRSEDARLAVEGGEVFEEAC